MWPIDKAPFEIGQCSKSNVVPLSHWSDYPYRIESEDPRNKKLKEIDPARLVLAEPLSAKEFSLLRRQDFIRLGGRALLTLWQHRKEIPERLWERHEETLPYTKAKGSSFSVDGLRMLNPHGVLCTFYLVRFCGEVRWGITPINYKRGPHFKALVYLC